MQSHQLVEHNDVRPLGDSRIHIDVSQFRQLQLPLPLYKYVIEIIIRKYKFLLFQLKKTCLGTTGIQLESQYQRNNNVQVGKVRRYLMEKKYLLDPKVHLEHKSINGKLKMSSNLVSFPSFAMDNIKRFIEAKINKVSTKLIPVYVTQEEYDEGNAIENQTIKDLHLQIFRKIENLDTENQKLQEEIFCKTVKNKNKSHYIEFYYKLCDLADGTDDSNELDIS